MRKESDNYEVFLSLPAKGNVRRLNFEPFFPIFVQMRFFVENPLRLIFSVSRFLSLLKISGKTDQHTLRQHIFAAWKFRVWDLKPAKLKHFFSSTARSQYNKIKFLDQNGQKTFKNSSATKIRCPILLSWNLVNWSKIFISGWKGKKDLTTSNDPNRDSHENNCPGTRSTIIETGKFYVKLFIFICTTENSSPSGQVGWIFTLT